MEYCRLYLETHRLQKRGLEQISVNRSHSLRTIAEALSPPISRLLSHLKIHYVRDPDNVYVSFMKILNGRIVTLLVSLVMQKINWPVPLPCSLGHNVKNKISIQKCELICTVSWISIFGCMKQKLISASYYLSFDLVSIIINMQPRVIIMIISSIFNHLYRIKSKPAKKGSFPEHLSMKYDEICSFLFYVWIP